RSRGAADSRSKRCHSVGVISNRGRPARRKVTAAAACWLALACAGCAPSAAPVAFGSGLPQVAASETIHRQEREMFALLNQDRRAEGLPPLAYDERLAD